MKKNIVIFLVFVLFLSIGINFYLLSKNNDLGKNINSKIVDTTVNNVDYSKEIYSNFLNINSLEDFINFGNKFGYDEIQVLIMKSGDKKSWNKYWSFMFDYLNDQEEISFIESIKQFGDNPKKGFLLELNKKFDEFNKGLNSLEKKDLNMDINLYYNSLEINNALKLCDSNLNFNDQNNHCKNKIYLYRATLENNYCDKISDSYIERICNDFLNNQKIK